MIYEKLAGQIRDIANILVKSGGQWAGANLVYSKVGGLWVPVFQGVPENLIVFYPAGVPSTHYRYDGSNGLPDLTALFPMGAEAEGSISGADTHATGSSSAFNSGTYSGTSAEPNEEDNYDPKAGTSGPLGGSSHYHSMPAHTHGSVDHQPLYHTFVPGKPTDRELYSGAVLLYYGTAAQSGWQVYSAGLGRYVKFSATGAQDGGASSHTHPSSSQGLAYRASNIDGDNVSYMAAHSHGYSHGVSAVSNLPSYRHLLPIQALADCPKLHGNTVGFFIGNTVPMGWKKANGSDGTPDLRGVLARMSSSDNNSGGSSAHTDTSPAGTSSAGGADDNVRTEHGNGFSYHTHLYASHSHSVSSHSHGSASSLPRNKPLMICIKD